MLPLSAAAALLALALPSSKPSPPNVVIVYADDLGFADLGVVGDSGHHSASPTIDALAASGVILNSSYVYVWCAPSRAALMTGRYSMHTGYMCGGEPGSGCAVPLGFPFLPQHLKQANYSTHHIGKWHLGMQLMAHLPVERGFDSSLGYLAGGEDYYTKVAEGGACKTTTVQPLDFWEDSAPATNPEYLRTYSAFIYAERAVQIINNHSSSGGSGSGSTPPPLFLYLAMQNVHYPLQVPTRFLAPDLSVNATCTQYQTAESCPKRGDDDCGCEHSCYCNRRLKLGMVAALDEAVGNITAALRTSGLWSNTVFWMIGDNGGEIMDAGNNSPLRGGKFLFYEGGLRSPALIAGPLLASKWRGQTFTTAVHNTDVLPTLCELAGVVPLAAAPGLAPLDGVSLASTLFSTLFSSSSSSRSSSSSSSSSAAFASLADRTELWLAPAVLRVGKYKLLATNPGTRGLIGAHEIGGWIADPTVDAGWASNLSSSSGASGCNGVQNGSIDAWVCRACNPPHTPPCLFDVEADFEERHDLAAQLPDVVQSLSARLAVLHKGAYHPKFPAGNTSVVCERLALAGGYFAPLDYVPSSL